MANKTQIIIVGGGFGGVSTAQTILKQNLNVQITLIDLKNYFLFTPLLHEIATGSLDENLIVTAYKQIFKKKHVNILIGEIKGINTSKKTISINDNDIPYDLLILGTGAKAIKAPYKSKNIIELKTIENGMQIKSMILDLMDCIDSGQHKTTQLQFAVIGGGPTGIEMVLELADYIRNSLLTIYRKLDQNDIQIYLITKEADILLRMHPSVRKIAQDRLNELGVELITNCEIHDIQDNKIHTNNKIIQSDLIVWTVGVQAHYPLLPDNIERDEKGKLIVDDFLKLNNSNSIYCVGDLVSGYPMDAQAATWHGEYLGNNLARLLKKEKMIYKKYKPLGELISLGGQYAAGRSFGITMSGWIVWFIWRSTYFFKIPTIRKKVVVGVNWFLNLFSTRDLTNLK